MQLGSVLVFDAGPLLLRNGGIDVERLRAYTAERLPAAPRARQRRTELALGRLAFFADDPAFQLDYHVRHASLPRPGDERALKRLVGRVFSQALDPDKPLWELWVVEGLEDGRFALIAKLDSALVEGDGRGDVLAALFAPAAPSARSAPRGTLAGVGEALFEAAGAALRPASLLASAVRGARRALAGAAEPSHCRIDWLPLDAADVAAVSKRLGAREADVLLATLAGGLRRLRERRGGAGELAETSALTPICVENGVAAPRIRLPLEEPDPRTRLVRLRAARERLSPGLPSGRSLLGALAELARAAAEAARADLVVAELAAGEAALLGAPLRAVVPVLPHGAGGPLRVTATWVGERIFLGLAADAVSMSDLSALADGVAASFDELRRLAAPEAKPPRVRRPRPRRRAAQAPRAEPELR